MILTRGAQATTECAFIPEDPCPQTGLRGPRMGPQTGVLRNGKCTHYLRHLQQLLCTVSTDLALDKI